MRAVDNEEKTPLETWLKWIEQSIRQWVMDWLEKGKGLFDKRVREGRIVDGHGDVRCESICVMDDGIRIYDCIEFNDRFRCGDSSSEVAFLAIFGDAKKPSAYGEGIYDAEADRLTYEQLVETGRERLRQDGAVILDATFRRASDRKALSMTAESAGAEIRWIECDLSPEQVRGRLDKRLERKEGDSDAIWETYERQRKEFEPLSGDALKLDTDSKLSDVALFAADWLRERECC